MVSNIQRYSLQDGPGIRTTVFFKGCPLQCAWCHNPENISPRPQVLRFQPRCVRCGACRVVCPRTKAAPPAGSAARDGSARQHSAPPASAAVCLVCGACVEACPTGARVLMGQEMTVDQLLAEILADQVFYDDSGGGVTFSGGEPLAQFAFLRAALAGCQKHGLRTALDTCGFAPREYLLEAAALTSLILYDVKFMDEDRHAEFCGVSNRLILENLQALARQHNNIWVRVPVIPGVNDAPDEMDRMSAFIATLPGVRQVNLLPYHHTGLHKFERLNQSCQLPPTLPPSANEVDALVARFAAAGLNAKAGG